MDPAELPPPYDEINEAVREDWVAESTPAERVKAVLRHTYAPKRVDEIADTAITTGKTARKHLETLARDGFVTKTTDQRGAARYRRSPASLVTERASRLLEDHSIAELTDHSSRCRPRSTIIATATTLNHRKRSWLTLAGSSWRRLTQPLIGVW